MGRYRNVRAQVVRGSGVTRERKRVLSTFVLETHRNAGGVRSPPGSLRMETASGMARIKGQE